MTVCDCLMLHGFLWEQLLLLGLYMRRGLGFPPSGMTGVRCLGGCKMPSCSLIRVPISQRRRLGRRCECGQLVVGSLPHPRLPALPSSFQDSLRTSPAPCPATPPSPVSTVGLGLQLCISHLGTSCLSPPPPEPHRSAVLHTVAHRHTLFPSGCRKKSCLLRPP